MNRSQQKKVEEVENKETLSIYAIGSNNHTTMTEVKLNDESLKMQLDTGSDVTIIPRNFWQMLGRPKLNRCSLKLKQFDGSIIKLGKLF